MASLREEARYILYDAMSGVSWFAVWKTGRSWNIRMIYSAEYTQSRFCHPEVWECDQDDMQTMQEIWNEDHDAVLLNGYYRNIGSLEEMTLGSLVDGIRWQYEHDGGNLGEILAVMQLKTA